MATESSDAMAARLGSMSDADMKARLAEMLAIHGPEYYSDVFPNSDVRHVGTLLPFYADTDTGTDASAASPSPIAYRLSDGEPLSFRDLLPPAPSAGGDAPLVVLNLGSFT
jgi:hypothetical protein